VQTRRLAEFFESLNSSLAQLTGELWRLKWRENSSQMRDFKAQYIRMPAVNMLNKRDKKLPLDDPIQKILNMPQL